LSLLLACINRSRATAWLKYLAEHPIPLAVIEDFVKKWKKNITIESKFVKRLIKQRGWERFDLLGRYKPASIYCISYLEEAIAHNVPSNTIYNFIKHGVDLNTRGDGLLLSSFMRTPLEVALYRATCSGSWETVQILIHNGARVTPSVIQWAHNQNNKLL